MAYFFVRAHLSCILKYHNSIVRTSYEIYEYKMSNVLLIQGYINIQYHINIYRYRIFLNLEEKGLFFKN
jgi:hypothetical protein